LSRIKKNILEDLSSVLVHVATGIPLDEELDEETVVATGLRFSEGLVQLVAKQLEVGDDHVLASGDGVVAQLVVVQDLVDRVGKTLNVQLALLDVKGVLIQVHHATGGHQLPGAVQDTA
jgi:hypothetical protein